MNNLKEISNKIEQPSNLKILLKDHQRTSIYAMQQLEQTGEINVNINSYINPKGIIFLNEDSLNNEENIFETWFRYNYPRSNNEFKDISYIINTNFGILADKVGSGKTLMIIGLIINSLLVKNHPKIIYSTQFTSIKYIDSSQAIKTNLILIPHNLSSQWYLSFINNTNLKVKLIHRHTALESIKSVYNISDDMETQKEIDILPEETLEYYDVIILTSTMAPDFFELYKEVKWSRIIIDEVLSIKLPSEIPWKSNFIWFITATPSGLQYIKKLYIRDLFSSLQRVVFNYLVIKNNDEYITNSMNLPILNQILIRCLTPRAIGMIKGFVSNDIMNMINAGNINEAITKINCNADTGDNIYKAITSKIEKELHNKKVELNYQEQIIPQDTKTHEEIIKKIKEKIVSLEERLFSIKEKISLYEEESCPICLMDFDNPAIMKCCTNLFCISCLTQINGFCPMCRQPFKLEDLNIIVKKKDKIDKKQELLSKQDNLINIIKKKKNGRFLIFSCYENTNDNIGKLLKDNKITYSKLLGTCGTINNIINKFNNKEINVLLLNAEYYGSGLNLQMATDIIIYHEMNKELETQIIGRSQRIGRKEPLNVYYLLYDNENHNVVNPSLDISIYDPNDEKLINFLSLNDKNDINKVDINLLDSDEEKQKKKLKKITNKKKKNNEV